MPHADHDDETTGPRTGEPATMSRIIQDAGVPQQTGSTALEVLTRIGAVESFESENHLGLALRTLTAHGAELRTRGQALAAEVKDRIADAIGTSHISRAVVLLTVVRNALDTNTRAVGSA